jgi:hypothetical protein
MLMYGGVDSYFVARSRRAAAPLLFGRPRTIFTASRPPISAMSIFCPISDFVQRNGIA